VKKATVENTIILNSNKSHSAVVVEALNIEMELRFSLLRIGSISTPLFNLCIKICFRLFQWHTTYIRNLAKVCHIVGCTTVKTSLLKRKRWDT